MIASLNNLTEIVGELLSRGADPNIKNGVLSDTDNLIIFLGMHSKFIN